MNIEKIPHDEKQINQSSGLASQTALQETQTTVNNLGGKTLSGDRRSAPAKKRLIIVTGVMVLVVTALSVGYMMKVNNDNGAENTQQSQHAAQVKVAGKHQLLICAESLKVTYDPSTGDEAKSDACLNDKNTLDVVYSHAKNKALIESYGAGNQHNLYLVDVTNLSKKQLVYSVDSSKYMILEKVWLNDDSGFFFTVSDDTVAKELGDPEPMSYYKVTINENKVSDPKKIYTSNGSHADAEHILGHDQKRDLLIMLRSGPGGCFDIYVINMKTLAKKELKNNSCDILVDYNNSLLYKVDHGVTGELLTQNYLDGNTKTLVKTNNGFFSGLVATEDFKFIYTSNNISGKKSGDNIEPKDEKNEIVRYSIDKGSMETVRSFSKLESIGLNSLSLNGNYLVFGGQDFSGNDETWPSYTKVLDIDSKTEKDLSLGEYSQSQYLIWLSK